MSAAHVLVIDDEPDILELVELTLMGMGLEVTTAEDFEAGKRALGEAEFDLCLTDMKLPDGNGLDLVEIVNRDYPHIPIAVFTAHGRVEDAVVALKNGAYDFVSKPVDLKILRSLVNTALRLRGDTIIGEDDDPLERMIGESDEVERVRGMIRKLSRSQAPVMISGPSGSGKELAARLIHDLGPRADEPFIAVNCGAIPTELMESEFFGHLKGSFTGANADKEGLFAAANGGTLFLDEVADLPIHMQVKLLRVIQEKAVRPIGARQEMSVDVRILSAAQSPLKPLVEAGKFRSDLYFRLNVIELRMPGLNERKGDIPMLAQHFLKNIARQWNAPAPAELSAAAERALQNHEYSGNVRELVNILQRATTLCEANVIQPDDLQLDEGIGVLDLGSISDRPDDQSLDEFMEEIEKNMLEQALKDAKYNKTRAAENLGISFRSFRYKLDKYGID